MEGNVAANNRDGHDADHPIEIDDSSDDEDDNDKMVNGDRSIGNNDIDENGVFDRSHLQQEMEFDQMVLDDIIQQAGDHKDLEEAGDMVISNALNADQDQVEFDNRCMQQENEFDQMVLDDIIQQVREHKEQEEVGALVTSNALNVDEDQAEFDSSCIHQENELDQMLIDDIRKAEELSFSFNRPSQATVNHDRDDENDGKTYSWKCELYESRSCRRDQEAVRAPAPVTRVITAPAPTSTFRTEVIQIDMRLPAVEEKNDVGDENRVLFARKDLQICLVDWIEKDFPNNRQIRTCSTALSSQSKTTEKSSGWSVMLVDNTDTPHKANLEVTGCDAMHVRVKNRLDRFLKSARNFQRWKSLFDDEDTILVDVDIDMGSLTGQRLGIVMDPIAFPRPRRYGAWIEGIKDNGLLWKILGSQTCEHINKFGGCLLSVDGNKVSQANDALRSLRKTQQAFKQSGRENRVDQKTHITFTLAVSKYTDFESLLENRPGINIRNLDGTLFDREHHREMLLNQEFSKILENNSKTVLPPLWVEYDENVVPTSHNMPSEAPIGEDECFEAYTQLMEDENSVEMDILILADDLGGTPHYFDHGAFLSNISDSSPFKKVLGKKATKLGLVVHLIKGKEFNNPDMLVKPFESGRLFGVTVVLFDGVDLRNVNLDCLYRRSITKSHQNYLLPNMMNPRRRKRPTEGYPLRLNQNGMARQRLELNQEAPNETDRIGKQNGCLRANNAFDSDLLTNNDKDSDDDFDVFFPTNDHANGDQNEDDEDGGDGSQQKHRSNAAMASKDTPTDDDDDDDTDNDFHEFFDAKQHIHDNSDDDNDNGRQDNRSNSCSGPGDTHDAEDDVDGSRVSNTTGLSSPSSMTIDSKRSNDGLKTNDSFSTPGGTKSRLGEYKRFQDRYYQLAKNNYKDCGIHIKTCISSMWKQHKAIFDDQPCHEHCPCIFSTKKLVENVFKDHETAKRDLDAGIFEYFAPTFIPKLREEYPTENSSQLMERLCIIWSLHKQDRVYGIQCGPHCECESEWDQQFGMGSEDKAKAFRMARKRPSKDPDRKDRSDGKTKIPRKAPAGNKAPTMNLLASPSPARKFSSNSSKFERHFNAQIPLGAFFGTETYGGVSTCKVLAINTNGQFGRARDVMPRTTVEAVMKADKRVPISSHDALKHHYNEAKRKNWHFNLVLFNPKYTNQPSGGHSDYWNEHGDWVGPADWNGWAGGANLYSPSTVNQNFRTERSMVNSESNVSRNFPPQPTFSNIAERKKVAGFNAGTETRFLVNPVYDESKKEILMKATREGTFDEFLRCLQSNICQDFLVSREGLKEAYDLCSTRLRTESDHSARKEVEMKKEMLKIYINCARSIEMAAAFTEWTTITIRIRRIEIFLKSHVADDLEKSDPRLEGIIKNRVVSAAPATKIDTFPLHIRQNNITDSDQDCNENDDETTPSIPTLDEMIADSDLIDAEDQGVWPDHILAALTQLIPCRVTENDKQGTHRHLESGFLGLCCRWCGGNPFSGRYFAYEASFMGSQDTHNAMFRHFESDCMFCPPSIWKAISSLKRDVVPHSSIEERMKLSVLLWKRVQSSLPDAKADYMVHPENRGIKYTQAERVATFSSGKNSDKGNGLRSNDCNATTIILDTEKEFTVKNNQKLISEAREAIIEICPSLGSFVFRLNDLEKESANDGSWTPLSRSYDETESWTKAFIEIDVKRAFLDKNGIAQKRIEAGKRVKDSVDMVTSKSRSLLNDKSVINDIQSIDGSTLLHAALCVDAPESLLKSLLQLGADPNQANNSNKSPNELVRNYESRSMKKTKELENNNAPEDRIENQHKRSEHFRAILTLFQQHSPPRSPTR